MSIRMSLEIWPPARESKGSLPTSEYFWDLYMVQGGCSGGFSSIYTCNMRYVHWVVVCLFHMFS